MLQNQIDDLEKLIIEGQELKALGLLERIISNPNHKSQIVIIRARLEDYYRENRTGIISNQDAQIKLNKIRSDILSLVDIEIGNYSFSYELANRAKFIKGLIRIGQLKESRIYAINLIWILSLFFPIFTEIGQSGFDVIALKSSGKLTALNIITLIPFISGITEIILNVAPSQDISLDTERKFILPKNNPIKNLFFTFVQLIDFVFYVTVIYLLYLNPSLDNFSIGFYIILLSIGVWLFFSGYMLFMLKMSLKLFDHIEKELEDADKMVSVSNTHFNYTRDMLKEKLKKMKK